jgi:GH25 family lysozyme M1 (1,4-beta-N-acetylmuramidase)
MNATAKKILEVIKASHLATGVDVSKYNGGVDFDEAEFIDTLDVIDYMMVRASSGVADGTVYIDPMMEKFYAELTEYPHIVRDAYHYLSSHSSWIKQYDVFMEAIDGLDFDILTVDGERIYNVKSAQFAGYAYYFLKQLQKDFPNKRVKFYSNKYDYFDWFDRYYDFDQFDYHHAQYPWARWDNVNTYYLQQFYQFINDTFSGNYKPNLPPSRNDYIVWQVAAYTGIGKELGFQADYLDINVSSMPLEEFRTWAHLYDRWQPEGVEPPNNPPHIDIPGSWQEGYRELYNKIEGVDKRFDDDNEEIRKLNAKISEMF